MTPSVVTRHAALDLPSTRARAEQAGGGQAEKIGGAAKNFPFAIGGWKSGVWAEVSGCLARLPDPDQKFGSGDFTMQETPSRFDHVEEMLNWVSDQDVQWWPFLFLRPAQHEPLGTRRVAAVSVLLGLFFGMLANVAVALIYSPSAPGLSLFHLPPWLTMPLATTALFFVFFRATFAASWNRRARRLAVGVERTQRDR